VFLYLAIVVSSSVAEAKQTTGVREGRKRDLDAGHIGKMGREGERRIGGRGEGRATEERRKRTEGRGSRKSQRFKEDRA
jgi:hypothetical protein